MIAMLRRTTALVALVVPVLALLAGPGLADDTAPLDTAPLDVADITTEESPEHFREAVTRLTSDQISEIQAAEPGDLLLYLMGESGPATRVSADEAGVSVGEATNQQQTPVVCVAVVENPVRFPPLELVFETSASCSVTVEYLKARSCGQRVVNGVWTNQGSCDDNVDLITAGPTNAAGTVSPCVQGQAYRTFGSLLAYFLNVKDEDSGPSDFNQAC